ncbi:MAG: aldehyde dehydrogenase family protein [Candidatus Acidiferrales bacterium]
MRDRDLLSIQEARELVARAAEAQRKFALFSQEQVDAIVEACAAAATDASEQLARLAVEETGYGNVPDKIIKNRVGSVEVPRAIRGMKTVGILRHDKEKGIVEVASPVGVVAAIVPTTNPTSTAIYKTLIAIKARNAVVHSPHPNAVKCIRASAEVMARAAMQAGAPEGLIACMEHSTMQGTQELMRHRDVGVILATGGAGLVRQAYSSGRPAYGVGPGNVPAYVERTANVKKAVADIIAGKTFDYGTICSSEQHIVADEAIAALAIEECRNQGAYFLSSEEAARLAAVILDPVRHVPNPKIVGKHATVVAEIAGLKVPDATRVLIARLTPEQVGRDYPLSAEKLSPVLAFFTVADMRAGIELCTRLLRFGGAGHTAAIHTQNEAVAREFGAAVPAFRVCVNTSAVHGSIGYSTNLFPAMTLGCGSPGGNITSDNIGPQHLMNVKRIAWESRRVEHRTIPAAQRLSGAGFQPAQEGAARAAAASASGGGTIAAAGPRAIDNTEAQRSQSGAEKNAGRMPAVPGGAGPAQTAGVIGAPDRQLIQQIVARVFEQRGIARGGNPAVSPGANVAPGFSPAPEQNAPSEQGAPSAGLKAGATEGAVSAPIQTKKQEPPPVPVVAFVSEADVRRALTKGEKIYIGPKTIVTPAARDLGVEREVLIETKPS